jgi:anti-anti-sigma regulatory factor
MFLRDYARQRGADAVLRTSRSVVARLVELLDLPGIKVQAAQ